jgi:Pyruvate/2-oxoacid:ferredoxin oxidoreductase delta subunit
MPTFHRFLDKIVAPSTRRLIQEARRTRNYSVFDFIHGYFYGRWPYLYIGVGTGEHWLARIGAPILQWFNRLFPTKPSQPQSESKIQFADTYHGKVLPLQTAREFIQIGEPLHVPDLEQVIPYKRARSLILQNPDHMVVIDCPCRVARPQPCLPLDVCMIIGEPFSSLVAEHHPTRSRWIDQEEALSILDAEDRRGHVHHAFFKDAMLGRFYAICNCCECCCGAMQAHRNGIPMLASSGYVAVVDSVECIACGACSQACSFSAIHVTDTAVIDWQACMGCGVCAGQCPQGAISLVLEPEKGHPFDLNRIKDQSIHRSAAG